MLTVLLKDSIRHACKSPHAAARAAGRLLPMSEQRRSLSACSATFSHAALMGGSALLHCPVAARRASVKMA